MRSLDPTTKNLVDALLRVDSRGAGALIASVPHENADGPAMEDMVVLALEFIGQGWEKGRFSLSQVYMAGRICERAMSEATPQGHAPGDDGPRLAIGVLEDHHALGKRMVLSALRSTGHRLKDYGHGRKASELVEMALRDQIDVLLISCLMLASAVRVGEVVEGLRRVGSRAVVVVGGAPFRLAPQLWKEVGAQAMGRNSAQAVNIIHNLLEEPTWA